MYYISKAPNGSAMVATVPPKNKPYVKLDHLPEGDGMLVIDNFGHVFRVPYPDPPAPTPEERIAALEAVNAALEDAICEMDAANEERMAAIEDALCEMDMG